MKDYDYGLGRHSIWRSTGVFGFFNGEQQGAFNGVFFCGHGRYTMGTGLGVWGFRCIINDGLVFMGMLPM